MDLPKPPSTVLGLTWREHIGGRWAVSLLGFAFLAPIAFVAAFVNVQRFAASQIGLWIAASALSLVAMGALWWLASVSVLRHRRMTPVPIAVVVLVGASSFAVRAVVATYAGVEWGLLPAENGVGELLLARAAVGAVQGAFGLPALAVSLSVVSRYRSERSRLLGTLVAVQRKRAEEEGAARALRDALAGPVRVRLQQIADRLGADASSIESIASDVRTEAHGMWAQSHHVSETPRIRIRKLIRISLSTHPLPLAVLWLVWLPSSIVGIVTRSALLTNISQALVGMLTLVAVYLLGSAIAHRLPRAGPLIFLVGTLGGGVLAGVAMFAVVGDPLNQANMTAVVVSAIRLAGVTLMVSVVESAVRYSEQVLGEIESSIEADEVALNWQRQEQSKLIQELAGVLHGVVQGRLAIAGRADSGSQALARQALDEGLELLRAPATATAMTAHELVHDISKPWSALMEIDTRVDEGSVSAARVRDVSDVVEECLSNAFRHGAARRVQIVMRNDGDAWLVRVADDGAGLSSTSTTGLGSSLLDAVSGGDWSRVAGEDGGCVVTVRVSQL